MRKYIHVKSPACPRKKPYIKRCTHEKETYIKSSTHEKIHLHEEPRMPKKKALCKEHA